MKKLIAMALAGVSIVASAATDYSLKFNPEAYIIKTLKMVDGSEVKYKAYEGIYYVTNVEDSTYQTLNFYVPEKLANGDKTPILLRTYVGGYMASTAKDPSTTDAKDLDTSFLVPINLATKLQNAGYDVNFALPWNRPHSGDYNLDDLFSWIKSVLNK